MLTTGAGTGSALRALRMVKLVHTAVWTVFVACIFATPLLAARGEFGGALVAAGLVLLEGAVLAVNGMRCPLTDVAARYTDERHPNFDIYLPIWLARYNKEIFGTLYLAGLVFAVARWLGSAR